MSVFRFRLIVGIFIILGLFAAGSSRAQVLWYNGNLAGQDNLRNQISSSGIGARVFDDFIVPNDQSWIVNSLWSNNAFTSSFFGGRPRVSLADWSIRTGVAEGNGGTIVASGINPVQFSKTGRAPNFLYEEWMVRVINLNLVLPSGIYWLNVTPIFGGDAYVSRTTGAGAQGQPKGNDGQSFFNAPAGGANFISQNGRDFSLGVGGAAVPEPGSIVLLASVVLTGLVAIGGRWRQRTN